MRHLILILAALGLSACATSQPPVSALGEPGLRLASLLEEAARHHPERILNAQDEMRALETVLLREPRENVTPVIPDVPDMHHQVGPAPDLDGARSLMHAVHLTSYRRLEHAQVGWQQLLIQLPALAGTQARLETIELEQGQFMRLKAGPLDSHEAAVSLCAQAEAVGLWCQPTHFTGSDLSD